MNETSYSEIAARHGINLESVKPASKDERLEQLKQILVSNEVPYPISPAEQVAYLSAAKTGRPFGIGPFGIGNRTAGGLPHRLVDLHKYANFQTYENYSFEEHLSWACLVADQQLTKHQYACQEYLDGESLFEIGGSTIPDFYLLNARIYQQTGWQLATVSEIIPAELFFTCHSQKFFPVTTFMRPLETDYLEEPDIGHDVAGHVATFTIPAVANVMKNHGLARDLIYAQRDTEIAKVAPDDLIAIELISQHADKLLAYAGRIYWFTVEFGLVMQKSSHPKSAKPGSIRCFGAGILSSPGETTFSVESEQPNRILIDPSNDADLLRLANTDYLISEFQKTYFISKSFELLDSLTPERIFHAAKTAMELPDYTWRELAPGDTVIDVGTECTSVNEKYWRLMANQPLDACLRRTAIHNLDLYASGVTPEQLSQFQTPPPAVPEEVLDWYRPFKK